MICASLPGGACIICRMYVYYLQDVYDPQDLYERPECNLCDLYYYYLYTLSEMESVRFAGSV